MTNKELLRRIDERDYLTEREHREFLNVLNEELERLEKQDKILKILKPHISVVEDTIHNFDTDKDEKIEIVVFNGRWWVGLNDEEDIIIKEWLDEK